VKLVDKVLCFNLHICNVAFHLSDPRTTKSYSFKIEVTVLVVIPVVGKIVITYFP
jgi:hypothetical protein